MDISMLRVLAILAVVLVIVVSILFWAYACCERNAIFERLIEKGVSDKVAENEAKRHTRRVIKIIAKRAAAFLFIVIILLSMCSSLIAA